MTYRIIIEPTAEREIRSAVRWKTEQTTSRGQGRFPVFATCPIVMLAHSQTIADQVEKNDRHCVFHSSRRTSSTVSSNTVDLTESHGRRLVNSPSPLAGEGRERGRTSQLDPSDKAVARAQPPSPQP